MGNITQYATQQTRPFSSQPMNAVDALVLASLAYQRMPDIVPTLDDTLSRYGTFRARARTFASGLRRRPQSHADIAPTEHQTAARRGGRLAGAGRAVRALARAPFGEITLGRVADALGPDDFDVRTGHTGLADPKLTQGLYQAVADSPRFASIRLNAYADRFSAEREMQFAAVTMLLDDGTLAVAFRGTDDTFVGWKEDFNMAFRYPVPAQQEAARYVCDIAQLWRGPIALLGHSKGGNLAVYAAINAPADVAARITAVYSLDGPGFPADIVRGKAYTAMTGRIRKVVPDASIVGMIFEAPEPCRVVRSDQSGPMQHLAFSWQVTDGDFDYLPDVAPSSRLFNRSLNEWLTSMSVTQRERVVDALFDILAASDTNGIFELLDTGLKAVPGMIGTFAGLSDEDRRHLIEAANLFIAASRARRR